MSSIKSRAPSLTSHAGPRCCACMSWSASKDASRPPARPILKRCGPCIAESRAAAECERAACNASDAFVSVAAGGGRQARQPCGCPSGATYSSGPTTTFAAGPFLCRLASDWLVLARSQFLCIHASADKALHYNHIRLSSSNTFRHQPVKPSCNSSPTANGHQQTVPQQGEVVLAGVAWAVHPFLAIIRASSSSSTWAAQHLPSSL